MNEMTSNDLLTRPEPEGKVATEAPSEGLDRAQLRELAIHSGPDEWTCKACGHKSGSRIGIAMHAKWKHGNAEIRERLFKAAKKANKVRYGPGGAGTRKNGTRPYHRRTPEEIAAARAVAVAAPEQTREVPMPHFCPQCGTDLHRLAVAMQVAAKR